jgi:hypothetical protein
MDRRDTALRRAHQRRLNRNSSVGALQDAMNRKRGIVKPGMAPVPEGRAFRRSFDIRDKLLGLFGDARCAGGRGNDPRLRFLEPIHRALGEVRIAFSPPVHGLLVSSLTLRRGADFGQPPRDGSKQFHVRAVFASLHVDHAGGYTAPGPKRGTPKNATFKDISARLTRWEIWCWRRQ